MHCFHGEYAILRRAVIYDEKLGGSGRGQSVSFSQSAAHVNDRLQRRAVQRGTDREAVRLSSGSFVRVSLRL